MEETEFEHIAQEMRPRLTAHCQRYLSAGTLAEEADDIVQETLVKLWKMRDRLSEYQSIEALGMTIARNLCIDHLRRNKVSQRMTRVFHQSVMVFNADESEFVGNFYESVALGFEETEFLFGGERRRKRIFYDRSQSGISHYESAAPASVELVGEYAKSVGVAIKARDVVPLCAAELLTGFGVAVISALPM